MKPVTLLLALVAIGTMSCNSGETKTAKSDEQTADGGGDDKDGAEPEVLIPMGLLDPVFLADARQRAQGGAAPAPCGSLPEPDPSERLAYEKTVIDAPARSVGQMLCMTSKVETLLGQIAGPQGLLAGKTIGVARGKEKLYALTDGYVSVRAAAEGSALPYVVAFLTKAPAGELYEELTTVAFGAGSKPGSVRAAIDSHQGRFVAIQYDGDEARLGLTATEKDPSVLPTAPLRSYASLSWATAPYLDVAGGVTWRRDVPAARTPALPRYHPRNFVSGDVELYAARTQPTLGEIVQTLSFLPSAAPTPRSYDDLVREHVASAINNTPSCATFGRQISTQLPDDVCAASSETLWAAISQACLVTEDLPKVPLASGGEISLCLNYERAVVLRNPQYLRFQAGARRLQLDPTTISATQTEMAKTLAFDPAAVTTALQDRPVPAPVARPLGELTNAGS